jgi:transposase-like protein
LIQKHVRGLFIAGERFWKFNKTHFFEDVNDLVTYATTHPFVFPSLDEDFQSVYLNLANTAEAAKEYTKQKQVRARRSSICPLLSLP